MHQEVYGDNFILEMLKRKKKGHIKRKLCNVFSLQLNEIILSVSVLKKPYVKNILQQKKTLCCWL